MPKKRTPKYRLHKPSGQAVVTIDGHDHYLGHHDSPESRRKYQHLVGISIRPGPVTGCFGVSVCEVCLAYSQHIEETYAAAGLNLSVSAARTRATIKALVRFAGSANAEQFGPVKLREFRESLIGQDLSRGYINDVVDETKRIFRYAATLEILPASVSQSLDMLPGLRAGRSRARETKSIRPVDDADVDKVLQHLPPVIADMVRLQRLLGCRPCEVCNLSPCEIERSEDVWFYSPKKHKNAWRQKTRTIPIGPRAQIILTAYLDRDPDDFCFSPRESEHLRRIDLRRRRKSKVQPSQKCRKKSNPKRKPRSKYDTNSYRQAIHRGCVAAGVAKWNPNQLRHAAATRIRAEFDLDTARTVLGHGSVSTTEIYAEEDKKKAADVARKIG